MAEIPASSANDISQRGVTNETLPQFKGKARQLVVNIDDGFRPVIMDGTTLGGKFKAASKDELTSAIEEVNSKINSSSSDLTESITNISNKIDSTKEELTASISSNTQKITANTQKITANTQKITSNTNEISTIKETYLPLTGGNITGSLTIANKNITFSVNGNSANTAGEVSLPIASTEEATAGTDDIKMMTSLKTKQAIDKFAPVKTVNGEEPDDTGNINLKIGSLPLGHLFAWPFQTPPDGAIQCNGATYSRALYAEFFAYISKKGWVKSESEWQSIASSSGGYCPWYSTGDGSTTFRTPKFAPFMQLGTVANSAGTYHKSGLPNVTGSINIAAAGNVNSGPFKATATGLGGIASGGYNTSTVSFDLSYDNSIYGRSSTVQPESNEWIICVVVAGQATNIGSVDVGNVMSAIEQVQANMPPTPNAYVVDAWRSGKSWYRKWSDGWIEQGGFLASTSVDYQKATVRFHTYFSTSNVCVHITPNSNYGNTGNVYSYSASEVTSTSFVTYPQRTGISNGVYWTACGY